MRCGTNLLKSANINIIIFLRQRNGTRFKVLLFAKIWCANKQAHKTPIFLKSRNHLCPTVFFILRILKRCQTHVDLPKPVLKKPKRKLSLSPSETETVFSPFSPRYSLSVGKMTWNNWNNSNLDWLLDCSSVCPQFFEFLFITANFFCAVCPINFLEKIFTTSILWAVKYLHLNFFCILFPSPERPWKIRFHSLFIIFSTCVHTLKKDFGKIYHA